MGTIAQGVFKEGGTLRGYVLAPLLGDIGISFQVEADAPPKATLSTFISSLNPVNYFSAGSKKDVEVSRSTTPYLLYLLHFFIIFIRFLYCFYITYILGPVSVN